MHPCYVENKFTIHSGNNNKHSPFLRPFFYNCRRTTIRVLLDGPFPIILTPDTITQYHCLLAIPDGAVSLLLGTDGMHDTSSRPAITVRSPYSLFSVAGQKKNQPTLPINSSVLPE